MPQRLSFLPGLCLLFAACGDSGEGSGDAANAGDTCGDIGAGNVSGSVLGEEVSPVQAAWYGQLDTTGVYVIVVDEAMTTCGEQGAGQHLVLGFCTPPAPGTVPIVADGDFPDGSCADDPVALAIVEDERGDLDEAVSGSVTIDAVGPCATGSFSATFDGGDSIQGSFSAIRCGTVSP